MLPGLGAIAQHPIQLHSHLHLLPPACVSQAHTTLPATSVPQMAPLSSVPRFSHPLGPGSGGEAAHVMVCAEQVLS